MDVSITMQGVDKLVADLGHAGRKATLASRAVIEKAAVEIKKGMVADFTGHRHAPSIPRAINYDIRGLSLEVGVDKGGPQGGLGNILAYGTSKNAAVLDHTAALRRELPAIERFLQDVAIESLG